MERFCQDKYCPEHGIAAGFFSRNGLGGGGGGVCLCGGGGGNCFCGERKNEKQTKLILLLFLGGNLKL